MMRVPGGSGTLLDAKAEGADIRMVYSLLDALRIAKENPDREVVFFAVGFETTAPSTALTLMRAKRDRVPNFFVFCNHVTIVLPLRALLESPDLRLDGFIGPGHVSTVVGARLEFIPADYGKPIVISGFEPLDLLQSVYMVLRQLALLGRCEVENQYKRVVPYDGNPAALAVLQDVFELRPHSSGAGSASSPTALPCPTPTATSTPSCATRRSRRPRRSESLPVRRGAEGRDQAVGVQGLSGRRARQSADRDLHGLERGRAPPTTTSGVLRANGRSRERARHGHGAGAARPRPGSSASGQAAEVQGRTRRWRTARAARRAGR